MNPSPSIAESAVSMACLFKAVGDRELSITKASVATGGTSAMGKPWAKLHVDRLVRAGILTVRQKGKCRWVSPANHAEFMEWAKTQETYEYTESIGQSWAEHIS